MAAMLALRPHMCVLLRLTGVCIEAACRLAGGVMSSAWSLMSGHQAVGRLDQPPVLAAEGSCQDHRLIFIGCRRKWPWHLCWELPITLPLSSQFPVSSRPHTWQSSNARLCCELPGTSVSGGCLGL